MRINIINLVNIDNNYNELLYLINFKYAEKYNYNIMNISKIDDINTYFYDYDYIILLKDIMFYYDSPDIKYLIEEFNNKDIIISEQNLITHYNKKNLCIDDIHDNFIIFKNNEYSKKIILNILNNNINNLYIDNYNDCQNHVEKIPYNIILNDSESDNNNYYCKKYNLNYKPYCLCLKNNNNKNIILNNYYNNIIPNFDLIYVIIISNNNELKWKKSIQNSNIFPIVLNNNNNNNEIFKNYIQNLNKNLNYICLLKDKEFVEKINFNDIKKNNITTINCNIYGKFSEVKNYLFNL